MNRISKIAVSVCLPIFFGAVLYYIYLPGTLFVSAIDRLIGTGFHAALDMSNTVVRWIRFYLFDFLWGYALMSAVLLIPDVDVSFQKLILVIVFEVLLEVIQISPEIKGSFDIWDIFIEIIAGIIVYSCVKGGTK